MEIVVCLPYFLRIIGIFTMPVSIIPAIINLSCVAVNLYCIMLQRYNCIRINSVIKKGEKAEKQQIEVLKQELKEKDSSIVEHTYKVKRRIGNYKEITFDNLIETANITQLKELRRILENIAIRNKYMMEQQLIQGGQVDIEIPLETFQNFKTLKLQLK